MKLADQYDVICAGGGLSSYLCSALLAKAGRKVLLIDDEDRAMPRHHEGKFVFDPDFALFAGLDSGAALGQCLAELGIEHGFSRSDSIIQLLTQNHRVVFSKEENLLKSEILRELQSNGEAAHSFFETLRGAAGQIPAFVNLALTPGQAASRDVQSWKRYLSHYYASVFSERPVQLAAALPEKCGATCEPFAAAMLGALSYSAPYNLGVEQVFRGLGLFLGGTGYCENGLDSLCRKLGDVVTAAGGNVKRNSKVESLITNSGKITGVLLSSFEGVIRAETVVISSRLRRLYQTLPENMRDTTVSRGLARIVAANWRFTIGLKIKRQVIPIGATDTMAYVGSFQYPLEEENHLRIQIVPEGVYPDLDDGSTATLLVTALVPYRASSMDYSYLRRLAGKMVRTTAELMPFLEENIVSVYPDFRQSEDELREAYPFRGVDWVPENLMQYYVRGHKSVQDFWGPSWTTPHRGLYFAGRAIWPALGIYGEALTARKIFDDVMLPK